MVAFARAFIQLDPDMRTFPGKAKEGVAKAGLDKEGEKHGRSFGKLFGTAAKAALAGIGALVAIKGIEFFGDIIKEGADAARTSRIVAAAIKSTGGAANVSVEQINKLTEAIGNQAGVDDSVVKAGSAMLLTFRNVRNEQGKGNDIFNRANKTLVDMTAALHGGNVSADSLRKQAIQLGKALNDPVKGLTALQRVGVTFTDQQKKQITTLTQSGHRLEAQKIILRELGKEFGGAAAASASPMQKLSARLHNFEEALGTALLPVINTFVSLLSHYLMPALSQFADWFQRRGAAALQQFGRNALPFVIEAIKTFATGVATIVKFLSSLPGPVKIAVAALAGLAVAFELVSANPFVAIIGGAILLVGLIVRNWSTIKKVTLAVWGAIADFFVAIWHRIYSQFVGPLIRFFTKTIPAAFNTVITWVRNNWPWLLGALTGPIGLAVVFIVKHWTQLRSAVAGIFNRMRDDIASIWNVIWRNTVTRVQNGISAVISFFKALPGRALAALQGLGSSLYSFASQALQKFLNGAKSIGASVVNWFKGLAGSIIHSIKSVFGIASPSSVFFDIGANLIRGLIKGIRAHYGQTAQAVGNIKYHVGAGVSQWAGLVKRALAMEGLSPMLVGRVLYQMQTESGGNPNAINLQDINAQRGDPSRGLMQTIMSTFRAYHWPGTSWNIYDPLANIAAALNYARHVYGPSLMSGGMGIGSGHGYALGGPITEPIVGYGRSGRRYTFGEAGEETVVPGRFSTAGIEARLEALIDAVERNSQMTGAAVAGALDGVTRNAAYAARYSMG